jgi:hypothetical protein
MNELDLVATVILSSGAGYLLGKHYERKKVQQAFRNFQRHMIGSTQATIAGIMDVVKKRLPDVETPVLMQEIVDACKANGAEVVAYNPATGHTISGKSDDNKAK